MSLSHCLRAGVITPVALAALIGALTVSACTDKTSSAAVTSTATRPAHHDHGAMTHTSKAPASNPGFQQDMDAGMAQMMTDMHSPGYSGNVNIDFLAMMIPHHQGAVDMARLMLLHGTDPATRVLAEEIIAGQAIEIESMQRRLVMLKQSGAGTPQNEFPVLGGTRGP